MELSLKIIMEDKQKVISVKNRERESNVELFRILAMYLVLVVHFTGWFVGGLADPSDSTKDLSFRVGQMVMEALSVVCVNCFLIISGWFGIRLKFKSIWKLYTLLFFIYLPFQLIAIVYTGNFSLMQLVDNLLVFTRESYFVQCYLMLMFLSPIINSFFDKYGKKALGLVIALWGIEAIMANVVGNVSLGINDGYSLIHFILMYMLAKMAALYQEEILRVKKSWWIIGYFVCAGLVCAGHLLGFTHTWDYSNPIVMVESFCLFFPFLYKKFYSRKINWLASSAFAVYIIHTTSPVFNVLQEADVWLSLNLKYWFYLPTYLLLCCLVFLMSVIYDKCREWLTKPLTDRIYNILNQKVKCLFVYE